MAFFIPELKAAVQCGEADHSYCGHYACREAFPLILPAQYPLTV